MLRQRESDEASVGSGAGRDQDELTVPARERYVIGLPLVRNSVAKARQLRAGGRIERVEVRDRRRRGRPGRRRSPSAPWPPASRGAPAGRRPGAAGATA